MILPENVYFDCSVAGSIKALLDPDAYVGAAAAAQALGRVESLTPVD